MRPHPWEELLGGALAARVFLKLAQNLFCNPGWMEAQFSLVAGQPAAAAGRLPPPSPPLLKSGWLKLN